MNILFTVCGRAGSKGVKNKNTRNFCGIPLVYYTLSAIDLYIKNFCSDKEADIVLNTDSDDLIDIVQQQNSVLADIIKRDISLSGDVVPKAAVIRDCLLRMEKAKNTEYDMVVDLDITSPLRTLDDIKNAIDKKASRLDTDVVFSVTNSRRNPYFNMMKQEKNFFCKAIPSDYTARQQAPIFYDMNASIYAYSAYSLKNKDMNTFFNDNCDAILMRDTGILDIDSEEDFEIMQVIAEYLFQKYDGYDQIYKHSLMLR